MRDELYIRTGRFEHLNVAEDSINPCSFGEDFAKWLIDRLLRVAPKGFTVGPPVQEDYGWGFDVSKANMSFWIALSFAEQGPVEGPAHWVVSVAHEFAFNPIRQIRQRSDRQHFRAVRDAVFAILQSEESIQVLTPEDWSAATR